MTPPLASLAHFSGTIVLLGAGKMGGALLEAWMALGLKASCVVILEPQPSAEVTSMAVKGAQLNPAERGKASAVVIAVKPQAAADALPDIAPWIADTTVVLSIMAGRTLAFLEQALPPGAAIVRAMPNMPAAIGRGITVAVPNASVSRAQRQFAQELLSGTGALEWIADEALMDAVTAVSGSGPAYVFLLAEALAQAGVAAGLPAALAATLARETIAGSGELLHQSPLDPATLRQNVTSPGGTTAAALDILRGRDGLEALLTKAVAAATRRSRELAG